MDPEDPAKASGPKPVTIIVNGEPHDVPKEEISFDEVVALAYPGGPQGPNIIY